MALRLDQLEGMVLILDQFEGMALRLDQLEGMALRLDQLDGMALRLAQLEGMALRLDQMEGMALRLDQLEGMVLRLDQLEGMALRLERISKILRELDPLGVANRRKHRFSRRTYINKGPNFLLHMDGYDKIKRFGFAIHGAICGFSRRVLWLNVGRTNNNPHIIGYYFMQYVDEIKGVPRCIRMDCGTENVLVEDIQKAFRWDNDDDMAGEKSVIRGSSHSNQRIERWWLSGKQGGGQYWIDKFKDMEMRGLLSTSNVGHIECARFSFMNLLQQDLDKVRMEWNQHRVRPNKQGESPTGKPDIMYFMPTLYDTLDYKVPANETDIQHVKEYCAVPFSLGCDEEYARFFRELMHERGLQMPTKFEEALELYSSLTTS
ncbi:uncharacterized protein LOC110457004 [Mizuhopecten yessoensis]|uniref:uncharacterized protein LOC110457004 n=1 Tax=Mizuhopecten yessoensis TaxID=6573 RepID=UPI000B4599AC|nr:uncharacterized protein LOC110457004 [Mizuhopecten yessoensis]